MFKKILPTSRPEVFCRKGVLRNFAKFTAKHLCQSLFLNKVAGLRLLRTPFLQNTSGGCFCTYCFFWACNPYIFLQKFFFGPIMLSLGVKHAKFVRISFCWCIKTRLYDGQLPLIFISNLTERQILVHSFLLIAIQFDVFKWALSSYNIEWRNGIKIRTFCTTTHLHLYHAAYPLCFVWKQRNELDNLIRANSTNHKYKEFFDLLLQSL